MHIAAVIPYHPQASHETLLWTLDGLAQQQLEPGHFLEVQVGIDGAGELCTLPSLPASPHSFALHALPRCGAAAVRNELVRRIQAKPDLLIFVNADTRPDLDMVQQHVQTMASLPEKSLVLGAAPWERSNPSVLDTLIDHTPMIFSYCHARPQQWYPFRIAYSLNLSVRYADFVEAGGFPELLRPYYFEDLAFACRVLGPQCSGVFYAPQARVTHRHNLTLAQYLDREELLGIMTPVVAQVCPEAFAVLMTGRKLDDIARDFRLKLAGDKGLYPPLFELLQSKFTQPDIALGQGEVRWQSIQRVYQLQMPLKLLAFRLGLLQGLEWADDRHWLKRRPIGLWRRYCGSHCSGLTTHAT